MVSQIMCYPATARPLLAFKPKTLRWVFTTRHPFCTMPKATERLSEQFKRPTIYLNQCGCHSPCLPLRALCKGYFTSSYFAVTECSSPNSTSRSCRHHSTTMLLIANLVADCNTFESCLIATVHQLISCIYCSHYMFHLLNSFLFFELITIFSSRPTST